MSAEATLAERAGGARIGIVEPPVAIACSAADVPGFHHASVALSPGRSGGGGTARTATAAADAAVAEALERWSAVYAGLDPRPASTVDPARCLRLADATLHAEHQRARPDFPDHLRIPADEPVTEVWDLATNEPWWAPAALVTLSGDHGALPTSSGLAAGPTVARALLRAVQELVERDAYVTTWLHGLGGRRVPSPAVEAEVAAVPGAEVHVLDLTPDWSPHPVAAAIGTVPLAGRPRHSLGLACRARWSEAVDKALAELLQGTMFIAHHLFLHPELVHLTPPQVTDFDLHAVYHSAVPQGWADLPIHRHAVEAPVPADAPEAAAGDAAQLAALVGHLHRAGIRLYYRELTSVDANQLGLRVVRVLAPDLTPLHHDHRWPFLGGRAADVGWRYADAATRQGPHPTFPSPHPHPLG